MDDDCNCYALNRNDLELKQVTKATAEFRLLGLLNSYDFFIQSGNELGESANKSIIHVPQINKGKENCAFSGRNFD